jgi:hypothetical protein
LNNIKIEWDLIKFFVPLYLFRLTKLPRLFNLLKLCNADYFEAIHKYTLSDIYSFGNPASFGNVAMMKEHKLLIHPPLSHSS